MDMLKPRDRQRSLRVHAFPRARFFSCSLLGAEHASAVKSHAWTSTDRSRGDPESGSGKSMSVWGLCLACTLP